jgi:deoxycytidine triphosphate deaminase
MPSLTKKREAELAKLKKLTPSEDDPHKDLHGVLLSDEIAFYANNHKLITPFDLGNLKPAAYELTIGDEYFLSGEFLTLNSDSDEHNKIRIPPFEVAVLKTAEIICLPRYLIARWNIRVRHAYSGLLWVGGPQVDPGYVGHLFCPIYNLSDKEVTLHVGEPIAVIDFVKTTPFEKGSPDLEMYPFPPKRLILEDYGIYELRSALFTRAGAKLAEFEEEIKNLEARFITFTQISFAIFALVIALVATSSKLGAENVSLGAAVSGAGTVAISTAAILIAIFSYVHWRVGRLVYEQYGRVMGNRAENARRFLRRAWLMGLGICMVVALAGGWGLYQLVEPFFQDVRQQRVLTKSDLDGLRSTVSSRIDELLERIERVERGRTATRDDLEKLRGALEQEIQALKSGAKTDR